MILVNLVNIHVKVYLVQGLDLETFLRGWAFNPFIC